MREGGRYVYGERGGEGRGEDGRMKNKPTEIIIIIKYISQKQKEDVVEGAVDVL
jgi:hypothetical protein